MEEAESAAVRVEDFPAIVVSGILSVTEVVATVSSHCSLIQCRNVNHCAFPFQESWLRHSSLRDHCRKETSSSSRPVENSLFFPSCGCA